MVRAKFRCNSITETEHMTSTRKPDGSGYVSTPSTKKTIKMSPVYSSDPNSENKKFWDASPGGTFELNIVNPAAVEQFVIGKEYYFDISPVPETPAEQPPF